MVATGEIDLGLSPTQPPKRRILKAVVPTATALDLTSSTTTTTTTTTVYSPANSSSNNGSNSSNNGSKNGSNNGSNSSNNEVNHLDDIAWRRGVRAGSHASQTEEDEEDRGESRSQAVQAKARHKREQKLQQRRLLTPTSGNNQGNGNDSGASGSAAKSPVVDKKPVVTPNPMSRFLRAFSVEPQHPEHKRAYEESPSDLKDVGGAPSEKRLRSADDDDSEDGSNGKEKGFFNDGNSTIWKVSPLALSSAAVVLLAVSVTFLWRSKSSSSS
jgi:hypothetical protein